MTDYTNLKLSIDGHTATVTLNNPPAHTRTMDSLPALKQLVTDPNATDDVYALTSAMMAVLSAGADLNNFPGMIAANSMAIALVKRLKHYQRIAVSVLQSIGYAMYGGLECALIVISVSQKRMHRWPYQRPAWVYCHARAVCRICLISW